MTGHSSRIKVLPADSLSLLEIDKQKQAVLAEVVQIFKLKLFEEVIQLLQICRTRRRVQQDL